jgi:hypothetical protein
MQEGLIKKGVNRYFQCFDYPLVVNSFGRSGSTVLTKALALSAARSGPLIYRALQGRGLITTAWDLDMVSFQSGLIYKSHDYPSLILDSRVKMIYTFGSAVDVVLSLTRLLEERGEGWMRLHFEHLKRAYPKNFESILGEDILGLENHLNSWLNARNIKIAFVRYESMWENQAKLSEFLGFNLILPEKKSRSLNTKVGPEILQRVKLAYANLESQINNLDDFFVINE